MIIKPKIRGFVCLTAHPLGCEKHVSEQITYVKKHADIKDSPKSVLVIGSSTGYGLSSRIVSAFGCSAETLGIFFEKEPSERKTATAGWYNNKAFEKFAQAEKLNFHSINGDAFSDEIKKKVVKVAKNKFNKFDLVVYSVAAPRRVHPKTGEIFKSVLKPIGKDYDGKTLDTDKKEIKPVHIESATQEEIKHTVAVMGGEDWRMWMETLKENDLLNENCKTVAYTYIGTELTWPIYWEGTIGKAKEDLDKTSEYLNKMLSDINGQSYVAVMKALVTQASSAIPVVPLYISILYKLMKQNGTHEGCIEQIKRLFSDRLYSEKTETDDNGRLRLDDWEMNEEIQKSIMRVWPRIKTDNIDEFSDFRGYQKEFLKLFGFGFIDIDYDADVNPIV